jgi:hypothetical protein
MLLYSQHITPRLRYVVDFIAKEIFIEPFTITSDKLAFEFSEESRLNYSDAESSDSEFFIRSTPLLFETGISSQPVECFEVNNHKALFQTSGDFPFDIFAATFYLLSRYEEYLPHQKDEFGRFAFPNSIAHKEGFLQIPLINIWLMDFRKSLQGKFPRLLFRHSSFKFIPTYDIDIAYSYLHKGWKRNMGGLFRSLLQGKWKEAFERIQVLLKRKKDPFDSYEWLDSLHLYCRLRAYYFFLVAEEQKGYDKNIPPGKKAFQQLIMYHSSGYTVGIHPSWQSGNDEKLLKEEIEWLEFIVNKKIAYSRQHYIRIELPSTYQKLIKAGIKKDFSMGYGNINGFRASIASSFYWYDLENEQQTNLLLFPFCFMDANSFYEQKFTAQQAMDELLQYYYAIKKVNGLMITIFHNHLLGTDQSFAGWKEAYEVFLKEEIYWDM